MEVEVAVLGSLEPNSPYGLCGRKATLEEEKTAKRRELRSCVKVEVAVLGSPVPNKPYGLCGRTKSTNASTLCWDVWDVYI